MLQPTYAIPPLPPPGKLETEAVLREAALAHRRLAEVKGRAVAIPNQRILIDTLSLQEAKASSEIENIVTTQDDLFKAELYPEGPDSAPAKEVARYRDALQRGWELMESSQGLLTCNMIVEMFRVLKRSQGGFRETPGTTLQSGSGEVVYVPPQDRNQIVAHMSALERFVNEDEGRLDPLVRMAVIHHQFESIHPFPDGNGRIGRIVNVLYLVRMGLLNVPILYLSRYIIANKAEYYRLLQAVREGAGWEAWIVFMLRAVADTSRQTLGLIEGIGELLAEYKQRIREGHRRLYSQELLNNLFRHPYTRIEFLQNDLGVARQTAARYLDELAEAGLLDKRTYGKVNYYMNQPLVALLADGRLPGR